MLFSTEPLFDAEQAFKDHLNLPGTPDVWRQDTLSSLSPLHTWVDRFGETDPEVALIRTMVDRGMDPGDVRNLDGVTLLHHAALRNRARLLPVLVEGLARHGEHTIDLREGSLELTALHSAAMFGAGDSLLALLALNADVTLVDAERKTALHHLALALRPTEAGHADPLQALLDAGAPVNVKDRQGQTPLHMAAMGDHAFAARLLLQAGAKVDLVNRERETALALAERLDHEAVATVLREVVIAREAATLRRAMGKTVVVASAPVRRRI